MAMAGVAVRQLATQITCASPAVSSKPQQKTSTPSATRRSDWPTADAWFQSRKGRLAQGSSKPSQSRQSSPARRQGASTSSGNSAAQKDGSRNVERAVLSGVLAATLGFSGVQTSQAAELFAPPQLSENSEGFNFEAADEQTQAEDRLLSETSEGRKVEAYARLFDSVDEQTQAERQAQEELARLQQVSANSQGNRQ